MPFRKLKPALAFSESELARLKGLQRSRTEEQRKVVCAATASCRVPKPLIADQRLRTTTTIFRSVIAQGSQSRVLTTTSLA